MTTKLTFLERTRGLLQWYRVPLMGAFVIIGIYFVDRASVWLWIGMATSLFGELVQLWSASHIKKDMVLAISGPYSHVRNPMYFGRFFVLLGFLIMIQQAWTEAIVFSIPSLIVAYLIIFAIYVNGRVCREEARLRVIFGDDYSHYCSEIRRFLPRLHPYSRSAPRRWQWSQIVANHEYLNLLAVIVVFALVIARVNFY
ncbi:MAG: isoprenylcysteine carboxylmethyltransferase family protein [Armatimonadetes bacterium]|nr:isoprenylcysteine carboxylmethyltransferase family protein [Armatimonadota bacterium]